MLRVTLRQKARLPFPSPVRGRRGEIRRSHKCGKKSSEAEKYLAQLGRRRRKLEVVSENYQRRRDGIRYEWGGEQMMWLWEEMERIRPGGAGEQMERRQNKGKILGQLIWDPAGSEQGFIKIVQLDEGNQENIGGRNSREMQHVFISCLENGRFIYNDVLIEGRYTSQTNIITISPTYTQEPAKKGRGSARCAFHHHIN